MFDDLKIRNKLILLVAGPLAIIVVLAGIGSWSRQVDAASSRQVAELAGVASANSEVVDALQVEALAGTGYVGAGRPEDTTALDEARARTDGALEQSLALMQASTDASPGFRSASGLAADAAGKLEFIRAAVDQGYSWDQVATTYGSLQETFLAVNDAASDAVGDSQVASELRTGAALAAYKAALARQGALLVGADASGGFNIEGSFGELQTAVRDAASQEAIFTSVADADRKGAVRNALSSAETDELERARNEAVTGGADGALDLGETDLAAATSGTLEAVHETETSLFEGVIDQARANQSGVERSANLFLIGGGVAILLAAAAAVVLGRRITQPLDRLTVAADELATEHMPRLVESLRNPAREEHEFELSSLRDIEVSSGDEIGQLASSFNDVQRVASKVAQEQAALLRKGIGDMFVNLARRNQALLDRQIEFIDELERGEEDPDQLENLYRLDHLATRMRRNAESLLVLAGAEPARRRGRPAPLANVVRAALAEVEDFNRIELLSFDEVLVASNAAADMAHLLSELMENAANFSPPETKVEVVGHRTKAEGYVISVSDHGIGMSADQLAESNQTVTTPPLVGLALSRSLGFIVVGRLARRHSIGVRLMASPSGGVTAIVSIPGTLLTDTPALGSTPPAAISATAAPTPIAPSPAPAGARPPVESVPAASAPPPPSAVPPLEFTPFDDAPATLAEAVPHGRAFEDALESLVAPPTSLFPNANPEPAPTSPPPSGPTPSAGGGASNSGLPTRRLKASPPPTRSAPGPTAAPEPLPEALTFVDPAGATPPTDRAAEPDAPAAREGAPRPDGPPPSIPDLPARQPSPPGGADPSVPIRTPGPIPEPAGPPKAPMALFSAAPEPAPAAPDVIADPTTEPGAAPTESAGDRTSTGLAKRTPRKAGATRAIPGADGERNVSATKRSPEEVRSMLSRYRDGQQRARETEPVPAGPPEEMDTHD